MNKFLVLGVLLISLTLVLADLQAWNKFKQRHGKSKKYNSVEDKIRYAAFKKTSQQVSECQKAFENKIIGYNCSVPSWADALPGEKNSMLGAKISVTESTKRDINKLRQTNINGVTMPVFVGSDSFVPPKTFDVRDKCAHSKCKECKTQINQNIPQGCGCCYAVSAIRTAQHAMCYQLNKCALLSNQEAIDCTYKYTPSGNKGCNGGAAVAIFDFGKKVGFSSAESYKFHATDRGYRQETRTCDSKQQDKKEKRVMVEEFFMVEKKAKSAKEALVKYGALALNMDVQGNFGTVKRNNCYDGKGSYGQLECSKDVAPNHAMTLLGWTVVDGLEYWIIENSWGCEFGKDGIVLLRADESLNLCGILNYLFGVVMKK